MQNWEGAGELAQLTKEQRKKVLSRPVVRKDVRAVIEAERRPMNWGAIATAATWVYRAIVLASILLGLVRMMNQQFVSRDLFLSEMHRLEQKIDALKGASSN